MTDNRVTGRDLDAEVAERVIGWTDVRPLPVGYLGDFPDGSEWWGVPPGQRRCPLPHYSRSMQAAFQVVAALRADGWWFRLTQDSTDIWDVMLWRTDRTGDTEVYGHSHEDSAPLAICRAALKTAKVLA